MITIIQDFICYLRTALPRQRDMFGLPWGNHVYDFYNKSRMSNGELFLFLTGALDQLVPKELTEEEKKNILQEQRLTNIERRLDKLEAEKNQLNE